MSRSVKQDYEASRARESARLLMIEADIDGELQDAEPSNYEEDNYDAGYIAGLTYAQDKLRAALERTP